MDQTIAIPMPSGRRPRLPDGLRIYAVGDVHGRLDLLRAMEEIIAGDARSATGEVVTVMLGDYIDRGPDSAGVIEHLCHARSGGLVALRGNHEAYLLDARNDPSVVARWSRFGGVEALASWGVDVGGLSDEERTEQAPRIAAELFARLPDTHLRFVEDTRLSWRAGDYLFVHAGIRPGIPLERQDPRDLLTIREPFHSSDEDFGFVVVHGHTQIPQPVVRANRIGLDTKAWASGRLTCLGLEGERRWLMTT